MLFKLAKYMRNSGIDTEYCEGLDNHTMLTKAVETNRIVITADSKVLNINKTIGAYVYLIYMARKTE